MRTILDKPRIEVMTFAMAMESKLRMNDEKGGWKDCDNSWLLQRAREELDELEKAMLSRNSTPLDIQNECADVANFVMMITDNIKSNQRNYDRDYKHNNKH